MLDDKDFRTEVEKYIKEIKEKSQIESSREHSYRTIFENFITTCFPKIELIQEGSIDKLMQETNEKQERIRIGIPDYDVLDKNSGRLIGVIEVKDLTKSLENLSKEDIKEIEKYKSNFENLVLSNYRDFIFYNQGKETKVSLFDADFHISEEGIIAFKTEFQNFCSKSVKFTTHLLITYLAGYSKQIKTLVKDMIGKNEAISKFRNYIESVIGPLTDEKVADYYAQTVVFLLLYTKLKKELEFGPDAKIDYTSPREYVIKTMPQLIDIFTATEYTVYNTDTKLEDLNKKIKNIIKLLNDTNLTDKHQPDGSIKDGIFITGYQKMKDKLQNKTKIKGISKIYQIEKDPVASFYEEYLRLYDPEEKKALGVFYTPRPIVNYIDSAVEWALKDLGYKDGFADRNVKVLEPAMGTGSFLWMILAKLAKKYHGNETETKEFIENHIFKDFYGFEILIISYILAHIKLESFISDSETFGHYKDFSGNNNLKLYLTNTLDDSIGDDEIKNIRTEKPITVIVGNPPYNASSQNKTKFIENELKLTEAYGKGRVLQDDYSKFIRFAEYKMEKVNKGVVGLITNSSFLDALDIETMRKHLYNTFNKIYIINLHGDQRRDKLLKEKN
ncbi:MAG: N-6 DNA methylase, partial [Nitrososphaerota archaeon]